jgi:hypothetical protein
MDSPVLRGRNEELKLAISLGINIAAIFDPTGGLSLVGAVEASTRGDYLGCALNLAGAIPILASSRRPRAIRGSPPAWTPCSPRSRCSTTGSRNRRMCCSVRVWRRRPAWQASSSVSAPAPNCCATRAGFAASTSKDWAQVGFLPKEVDVLREFAQQGYYIVIRACNPSALSG